MKTYDLVRIGKGKTLWSVRSINPQPGHSVLIQSTNANKAGSGRRSRLSRLVPYDQLTVVVGSGNDEEK